MIQGLTNKEAEERLRHFGLNVLPQRKPPADFSIFLDQLKNPLIYILILAALISFFLKDFADGIIISLAVFLNTILGFYQERKAEKAITALKSLLTPTTRVLRDGQIKVIPVSHLVPQDIVLLKKGDKVPADGEILEEKNLFLDEAILTGESQPVEKKKDQSVFMGTIVVGGQAKIKITKTGKETELGKIAHTLGEKEEKTPLQEKLEVLARQLAVFILIIASFIFLIGIFQGKSFIEIFTAAIALAVSAIPEGLVVSLTAILAIGMQRILARKALVKKLLAAETLGGVTVICLDKTGTITKGSLEVVKEEFIDQQEGRKAAILANDLEDPLEISRWEYFLGKDHLDPQKIVEENPRVDFLPFSHERRFLAVACQKEIFLSGAPEVLLERSQLTNKEKISWQKKIEKFADLGFRLVAFAKKENQGKTKIEEKNLEGGFSFLGLMAFADPPREGVKEALKIAQEAGIKIKVITGDYRRTAEVILEKVGLRIDNPQRQIMEGEELEKISFEELRKKVAEIVLFVRTKPYEKLKIVQALKENGEIVAMMGDGVNDAPALLKADIGIVVEGASDVAQETADLILLETNFETILAAIEEGRGIFDNLRKVIVYLLADAFGEILLVLGSLFFGLPLALNAAQILWINLVSDGFPSLALIMDPKRKNLMREKPRSPQEKLINNEIKFLIFLVSGFYGLVSFLIFFFVYQKTGDLIYARSLAFLILGVNSLFYVFSCRNLKEPLSKASFFNNPWLILGVFIGFLFLFLAFYFPSFSYLLRTKPLGLLEWGLVGFLGIISVLLIELTKKFFVLKLKNND